MWEEVGATIVNTGQAGAAGQRVIYLILDLNISFYNHSFFYNLSPPFFRTRPGKFIFQPDNHLHIHAAQLLYE